MTHPLAGHVCMAQLPASAAALEIQVAEVESLSRSGGLQRRLRVAALATVLRCADVPSLTAAFSRWRHAASITELIEALKAQQVLAAGAADDGAANVTVVQCEAARAARSTPNRRRSGQWQRRQAVEQTGGALGVGVRRSASVPVSSHPGPEPPAPPPQPGARLLRQSSAPAALRPSELAALRESIAGAFHPDGSLCINSVSLYSLGKPLGQGSSAHTVRIGRHKLSGALVAVKSFRKAAATEAEPRAIQREVASLRRLSHPRIVRLYEADSPSLLGDTSESPASVHRGATVLDRWWTRRRIAILSWSWRR